MNRQIEWKNRLLTLPDSAFFNLMRNYIGNLETPFNKHKMIEKLHLYLMKESNLKLIANGLDELDKKILAIIFLLDGSPEAPIIDLLQNRWSSWEVRQRMLNLQERLLLFKGGRDLFFPTPQTESFLRKKSVTARELFPAVPRKESRDPAPWLNDSFLTAFLSCIIHCSPARKTDGTLTRRGLSEIQAIFPSFRENSEEIEFFLRFMKDSGLIEEAADNKFRPVFTEWTFLSEMASETRITGLWADFLIFQENLSCPWKQSDGERIITGLIKSIPATALYSTEGITRILSLLLAEKRPPLGDMEVIFNRLSALGILIKEKDGIGICRHLKEKDPEIPKNRHHTLHPSHEITLMPGEDFKSTFPLAWYARIQSYDQATTYILDQKSFFNGLHRGKELAPFEEVIASLSGSGIPQNVEFSLKNWQDQFRSVRLLEGIVLKVDTPRIPFIEKNPLFKPYIREILAPGVYLMDPQEKSLWENSLLNTGITAIPPVEKLQNPVPMPLPVARRVEEGILLPLEQDTQKRETEGFEAFEDLKKSSEEELLKTLEKLTLPEGEKEELEERIRKKVILLPSQLKKGIVQKDIREARGLDYSGKIRLIEMSVSTGQEYLEISWFTPDDDLQIDRIIPRHLSKENNDLILSGPYLSDPGGSPFRIRVRKISNCKRKKLSFFGI